MSDYIENDCMDVPPCFHSNEQATIDEWNRWDGGKYGQE